MATINMGPDTYAIPVSMFKENRLRVISELRKQKNVGDNSYVLLQGGDNISLYNTDVDYIFRQVCFVIVFFCPISLCICILVRCTIVHKYN